MVSFGDQPPEYTSETSLNVPNNADGTKLPSGSGSSLSRSQSKLSDGLGRTLSKLGGKKSEERLPEDVVKAEVHVTELTERVLSDKLTATPAQNASLRVDPTKGHKREKSRSRLSRSKNRSEKPDRECSVM